MKPPHVQPLMSSSFRASLVALALSASAAPFQLQAQPLFIPNASFESPSTPFVDNHLDRWQRTPKPFWYDEAGGFGWDQLFGVFKNTEPDKPDHIVNAHGSQAIYLFAFPEAGIYQDAVAAGERFTVGASYTLTAGIIGGGGGMTNGASLEMSLYYLDDTGNRVAVGATNIVHDPARFPDQNHFVDIALHVPTVRPSDAWAGRPIGVRFLSTIIPAIAGGYWDLDNVRLSASIDLPNDSFESPATDFVDNRVDAWQKTPKPFWYDESGGFTWDQLSGVFKNTEPGKDDHLENADGAQAFYLFAVPGVGIQLDAGFTNSATPFLARFQPGNAYSLTTAVQGGGGGMTNGVTLQLALYYLDASGMPQVVASTTVTNDTATFPSRHLLSDFAVRTPTVNGTDPWAGKGIGIRVLSTVDPALAGGYWNIDHPRLLAHPAPALLAPGVATNQASFVIRGDPGSRTEILSSDDIAAPAASWMVVATLTNTTGFLEFKDVATGGTRRYYQSRQLP
ncbi:MAG: hypothetical protein IT581_10110 [Verrucomicrobiales bacterium]|nr:hypothetical protein [Verrucomicrobiales bacterium]